MADYQEAPSISADWGAELKAFFPLGLTRLRVVLAHFKQRGVVRETNHLRLRLEQTDVSRKDLECMARAFLEHLESPRLKLQHMGDYAEPRTCRCVYPVQYVDQDDKVLGDGGHCDHCQARAAARELNNSRKKKRCTL